jgi:hypothetical protein
MRGLTVRQPWAWAIVHGGKDVENRSRNLAGSYRGPVAIHAGLALCPRIVEDGPLSDALSAAEANSGEKVDLFHGFVLGVVDLTDVHDDGTCLDLSGRTLARLYRTDPDAFHEFPDNGCGGVIGRARMCSRWAQGDHHHLVLANPRPLAHPIPWRGALGLWTVPADLEAAIREQVAL